MNPFGAALLPTPSIAVTQKPLPQIGERDGHAPERDRRLPAPWTSPSPTSSATSSPRSATSVRGNAEPPSSANGSPPATPRPTRPSSTGGSPTSAGSVSPSPR